MKRIFGLVLALAFVSVIAVGCGGPTEEEQQLNEREKMEAAFRVAAEAYYNKFQRGSLGQDFNQVTIERLETTQKNWSDIEYDLSALANCDKNSSIYFQVDKDRNIIDTIYELNCD